MAHILLAGLPLDLARSLQQRMPDISVHAISKERVALSELAKADISLLVLDCSVTASSGLTVTELISDVRSARAVELPVIYCMQLSGQVEPFDLPGSVVLFHPINTDLLARTANTLLQRSQGENADAQLLTVERVWKEVRVTNDVQIGTLEDAALHLLEAPMPERMRAAAADCAAGLLVRLRAWGLIRGSRLAADIETVLREATELGTGHALRLCDAIAALRGELDHEYVASAPAPLLRHESPLFTLVDHSRERCEAFILAGMRRGIRVEAICGHRGLDQLGALNRPEALVINLDDRANWIAVGKLAARSGWLRPAPSLYTIADTLSFDDRLRLARSGVRLIFDSSLTPWQMVREIEADLQGAGNASPGVQIVLLSNDSSLVVAMGATAAARNAHVRTAGSPEQLWKAVETSTADVLVLDLDAAGEEAIPLIRALRSARGLRLAPLLCVGSSLSASARGELRRSGADDVLSKNAVAAEEWQGELTQTLWSQVERCRVLLDSAQTDVSTGLINRRRATELLEQMLRLADQHHQRVALALLCFDAQGAGAEALASALREAARGLRRQFRAEDVLGRWTAEQIVVGMFGATRDDGVHRLTTVLGALRSPLRANSLSITLNAGVAQFPEDGSELRALERAAADALDRGRLSGGDRVLRAGWGPNYTATIDIDLAIVDSDEPLVEVLRHSLQTRGYGLQWFNDGGSAANALMGPTPVRARVILLALGIPSMDGLSLLRTLAREGVTTRSRVIVISSRSGESEVVQALELGAFDYVPKPVSVPLLLQRIRRALIQ